MGCIFSSGRSANTYSKSTSYGQRSHKESRKTTEAKLVLLGETGVGKSSLALRFSQGKFSTFHEVTIGSAFLQQTVLFNDGGHMKLLIWDTGGQERFRAMAPLYYRDADGAIIVYDSSFSPSFEAIKFWISELRSKGPPNCSMIVAANKSDLPSKQISYEEGKAYCSSQGITFIECSAKTGENVGALFTIIAQIIAAKNSKYT